jgi:hypothetical protein
MARFDKRPDQIDAAQWTGDNQADITALVGDAVVEFGHSGPENTPVARLALIEGVVTVHPGDYVVKDSAGGISRCDADTFDAAYVPTTNR